MSARAETCGVHIRVGIMQRTQLKKHCAAVLFVGAGYGNRTRLSWLGTKYSTDELTLPVYGFILSPIPFFVKPREKNILAFRS